MYREEGACVCVYLCVCLRLRRCVFPCAQDYAASSNIETFTLTNFYGVNCHLHRHPPPFLAVLAILTSHYSSYPISFFPSSFFFLLPSYIPYSHSRTFYSHSHTICLPTHTIYPPTHFHQLKGISADVASGLKMLRLFSSNQRGQSDHTGPPVSPTK